MYAVSETLSQDPTSIFNLRTQMQLHSVASLVVFQAIRLRTLVTKLEFVFFSVREPSVHR